MSSPTESPSPKTVLVGVQLPGVTDAEQRSSLMELKRLCKTLGFEVVGEVTQKRKGLGAATLLGEGKLVEQAAWTGGTGVVPKGPDRRPITDMLMVSIDISDVRFEASGNVPDQSAR